MGIHWLSPPHFYQQSVGERRTEAEVEGLAVIAEISVGVSEAGVVKVSSCGRSTPVSVLGCFSVRNTFFFLVSATTDHKQEVDRVAADFLRVFWCFLLVFYEMRWERCGSLSIHKEGNTWIQHLLSTTEGFAKKKKHMCCLGMCTARPIQLRSGLAESDSVPHDSAEVPLWG